uniref:CCHC-type domain-containing protein n=1 Tax=Kalanchoe fedtschenkoi TaxID=63787 RepID=A0A7N0UHX3_KALFE
MDSEDFPTLPDTGEAGENKLTSPAMVLHSGNDSKFVDPETVLKTVQEGEGPMEEYLNQLDKEAEPHPGSARELVGFPSISEEASLFTESVTVSDNVNNLSSTLPIENGDLSYRGVKRSRVTSDEHTPSVHVIYNSLTSQSKQKLEALLQQWSAWDAKHCSSIGSKEMLECGEATYYPALYVGSDKPSTVSFWLDNQTSKDKEASQMDDGSVPVYDRGYALLLTSGDGYNNLTGDSGFADDSRCFNCGSYNHSLKECPKPRDNAAVKNARKQHKTKRNQNPNSRNPTRYYQNTPSGKYDGLRPGVLEAETRKLLGLGELDPPPWLDRMREIGYPPGYLDADEGEPSGLAIFGEEETKEEEEKEDGEIQDMELSPLPELTTLPKKMSVDFPGINAPIPADADERLWDPVKSNTDSYGYQSSRRFVIPSDSISRDQFRESRWARDLRDDCPPGVSTSNYSYSSRYASYGPTDSFESPRRDAHPSRSTGSERSEREGRSPRQQRNVVAHVSYDSQNHPSRPVSDDLKKYGDGRDPYSENLARHGYREGRESRHMRR